MKNQLYIVALFFSCAISAQNSRFQDKKVEIRTIKVAFITNEIGLTAQEAEKFWPVYNAFDDKQSALRRGGRTSKDKSVDLENISESEAASRVAEIQNNEDALYDLRKKYSANLKGILSNVKILKLKRAEENFNRKLLRDYREKARRK